MVNWRMVVYTSFANLKQKCNFQLTGQPCKFRLGKQTIQGTTLEVCDEH